jgi:hypothetical protein
MTGDGSGSLSILEPSGVISPIGGGSGGTSSVGWARLVGWDCASAGGVAKIPAANIAASIAGATSVKRRAVRVMELPAAERSAAELLQRQPVIGDLDLHFGGRWRPLISPQEYDSGREQHDDGNDESDDDPIHNQVLEIKRFARGKSARVDGW